MATVDNETQLVLALAWRCNMLFNPEECNSNSTSRETVGSRTVLKFQAKSHHISNWGQ
jgi:hypothetical protein